jgi:phosphosulfolactate phosphohydrolase-like enzyme
MTNSNQILTPEFSDFCKAEAMKNMLRAQLHLQRGVLSMHEKAKRTQQFYQNILLMEKSNKEDAKKIRQSIEQKKEILKRDIPDDIKAMIRQDIELLTQIIGSQNNLDS